MKPKDRVIIDNGFSAFHGQKGTIKRVRPGVVYVAIDGVVGEDLAFSINSVILVKQSTRYADEIQASREAFNFFKLNGRWCTGKTAATINRLLSQLDGMEQQ